MNPPDDRDQRKKLAPLDYKAIRFAVLTEQRTIREVANTYSVSTKYVKRILTQTTSTDATVATMVCSGCGYSFTDIQPHWATWTSGGTRSLACGSFAP